MSLTISVDLPRETREIEAVRLFRKGKLNHFELSQTLGLDRFETDRILQRHCVEEQNITMDDIARELAGLNELLGPPR